MELVTAFSQHFRLAEGASVTAAITQKQHHDWVEAYLVQVEGRLKARGMTDQSGRLGR
jgi:hypothetical protein